MSDNSIILLFIKAPIKGQVKSRMAAAVGDDAALELYRNFVLDIVDMLKDSAYQFRICLYPPASETDVADWLGHQYQYMPQTGRDLGERMERAFSRAFSEGFNSVVLIGSDIPDLSDTIIREAFESLKKNSVVLGPAADGGYYLVGFNKESFHPELFHGIEWSTNTVFRESMKILRAASLLVHQVPEWNDVDSLEDLKRLFTRNKDSEFRRSRTMEYLNKHGKRLFS